MSKTNKLAETPNTDYSFKDFLLTTNSKSKLEKQYGERIAQYINSIVRGTNSYFFTRNNRFRLNRAMANGRMDVFGMFRDRLGYNGKQNYANISFKAPAIISTVISRQVGAWMGRGEKIEVSAVDPISLKAKDQQATDAEFYYEFGDVMQELEEGSGVPMIPKDQFIAEDKDELDAWVAEFNRIPEEIKYEIGVNNILEANGWTGVNKEKALHDSAEVGLLGTYTYMDETGQVHIEWIKPENIIYSYSEYPDFRDTSWRGHVYVTKISELRAKYGKQFNPNNPYALSEEDIFKIAQTAKEYQNFDKLTWINDWNFMYVRPYDEWNVDTIRFELRSVDKDVYVKTVTKTNKSTIISKNIPTKIDENQEVLEDKKWNIYEGVYLPNTMTLLHWSLKQNMIRPQDPKELGDAEFSYSFYMYQNYDMRNLAIPEKVEEPVEQMILARLKIQQLVAKMKPAGAAINVDALQEMDLGLAESTTPLEGQRIWEQTGNLYYRGRDAEGNPIPLPITELQNSGFVSQLQALIQLYQFHYQVLKDELGQDPNLSTQATRPRVTAQNVDTAVEYANDSSDYMYDAFLYLMEDTSKKVACLLNTSVSFGAKAYRDLLKEEEVKGRVFKTVSRMKPTNQEIAELQMQLKQAVASNPQFAVYLDQFKIIRIAKENIKLAELYYNRAMKRMIRTEQENASKNSMENAKIQEASMMAKAEGDAKLEDTKNKAKEKQILMQGIIDLAKVQIPIPQELRLLTSELIKSVETPLIVENDQMEQALEQQMMQEEQAMQQEQPEMSEEEMMMMQQQQMQTQ